MAVVDGLTGLSAANPSAKVVVVDHAGVQVRGPPTWVKLGSRALRWNSLPLN